MGILDLDALSPEERQALTEMVERHPAAEQMSAEFDAQARAAEEWIEGTKGSWDEEEWVDPLKGKCNCMQYRMRLDCNCD